MCVLIYQYKNYRSHVECSKLFVEFNLGYLSWFPHVFSNYVRIMNTCKWEKDVSFDMIVNGMILWWSCGYLCEELEMESVLKFVFSCFQKSWKFKFG